MACEAFDGASPAATHTDDEGNYDELLGPQEPTDAPDWQMLDFHEDPGVVDHALNVTNITLTQVQPAAALTNLEKTNRISSLLGQEEEQTTENTEISNAANPDAAVERNFVTIQKEDDEVPFTAGKTTNSIDDAIEISDTKEPKYKHGTTMYDGVVILSDTEDEEVIVYDGGSSSVAIKKENPDVEIMGAKRGIMGVSDSDRGEPASTPAPKLGKSFLQRLNPKAKRTPPDVERMRKMQRLYTERALSNRVVSGAGRAFKLPQVEEAPGALDTPSSMNSLNRDNYA